MSKIKTNRRMRRGPAKLKKSGYGLEILDKNIIHILMDLQNKHGSIDKEQLNKIALKTKIPLIKLYGLVTYYNEFRMLSDGRHTVTYCRSPVCDYMVSRYLREELFKRLDGNHSNIVLRGIDCKGSCITGPHVSIDGKLYTGYEPDKIFTALERIKG